MSSDEKLQSILEASPFMNLIGCRIVKFDIDSAVLELDLDHRHMNTHHVMHGGVMTTMLDYVMALAAHAKFNKSMVTTQLNTSFLKSVQTGKVIACGTMIHHSNRTATLEGRLTDEAGDLLAYATGSFLQVNKEILHGVRTGE